MMSYVKVERNELEHAVLRQQESNRKRLQYVDSFCWIRLQTHLYISEGLDIGRKNYQSAISADNWQIRIINRIDNNIYQNPTPPSPHFLSLSKKKTYSNFHFRQIDAER